MNTAARIAALAEDAHRLPVLGDLAGVATLASQAVTAVETVALDAAFTVLAPLVFDGAQLLFGGADQGNQPSRPPVEWREQAAA